MESYREAINADLQLMMNSKLENIKKLDICNKSLQFLIDEEDIEGKNNEEEIQKYKKFIDEYKSLIDFDNSKISYLKVVKGEFDRMNKDQSEISILKKLRNIAVENQNEFEQKILDNYIPKEYSDSMINELVMRIIVDLKLDKNQLGQLMKIIARHPDTDLINKLKATEYFRKFFYNKSTNN